jgi:ATP-dependent 26S proteasome regulatory subunit
VETHPKYETIYAYLNNDVTRKWPTCDLTLRLFAPDLAERTQLRRFLLPQATLFSSGLLRPLQHANDRAAWLSTGFSVAPELYRYLLSLPPKLGKVNQFLARVQPRSQRERPIVPSVLREQLERVPEILSKSCGCGEHPLMVFLGQYGAGAEEIADDLCARIERRLLYFSVEKARTAEESLLKLLQPVLLEQKLESVVIFVSECGSLFGAEGSPTAEGHTFISALAESSGLVFLAFSPHMRWRELLQGKRKLVFELEEPDFEERRRLWQTLGEGMVSESMADDLANRFILNSGQIHDAVVMARDHHFLREGRNGALTADDLLEAARAQSDQNLGKLATRVRAAHTWKDLVLPAATLKQIREISAAIRFRHHVYSSWGFDQRLVSGKGLKVLFSGAAGTGKTMTAGIIARDLGLDLYKIDLSGIVSKFIGETEKNLDRIFRAAQSGNAILFFDEADALFGKRSEVKDAHDRYANIEVAYLLQKMDDHDGVVILATNLSKNLDEAFSRRMHYVVEFPLPNAAHREQLWRGMFPPQAPVADDVDFKFLSDQFALPGGDIRNVVLSAAFLAAQDGTAIHMRHLVPSLGRLMVKKGKVPSATEFKQYHSWLSSGD